MGYQAPAVGSDSPAIRADPKDKIQVLSQMLHAGDLRSRQRFAEADTILTSLQRSDPALYIIAFEHGETLLDWGKARESTE